MSETLNQNIFCSNLTYIRPLFLNYAINDTIIEGTTDMETAASFFSCFGYAIMASLIYYHKKL